MLHKESSFFMGANTPQGFVSYFDELTDPQLYRHAYVIKGGPGTGKSTLMGQIAKKAKQGGCMPEYIYCSSDPDSLDAIILHEKGTIVADGTPPHIIEPKYPGAFEKIIPINQLFDCTYLEAHREQIIRLIDANKQLHARTSVYLSAAGALRADSQRIVAPYIRLDKLARYTDHFVQKNIKATGTTAGRVHKRFLSSVGCKGYSFFWHTIAQYDRIINIRDEYGVASAALLNRMKKAIAARGYDVYACYCPLAPNEQLEHLLVPQLQLAFTTSNRYHCAKGDKNIRNINATRFCDDDELKAYKNRLSFNRKAVEQILRQAIENEKAAKENHDEIEKLYTPAVDFVKNKAFFDQMIKTVLGNL